MIAVLFKLKDKLGIDKSIFFTSLARIIQAVGGVVSILFVARYLTEKPISTIWECWGVMETDVPICVFLMLMY